jgi:putative SOS response-associated peptidase YedK
MCGRFVSASPPDEIAKYFGAEVADELLLSPSYNVAPTNDVYVVLESGGVRRVEAAHWGLVPHWAKSPAAGSKMINARAETLATKNAYKPAFRKRRCLIPADGFYEWKAVPGQKKKQPMYIHRTDDEPLAFAGLWSVWRGPKDAPAKDAPAKEAVGDAPGDAPAGGEELRSCTIITTEANEAMSEVHDRMPVILPASAWAEWLAEGEADLDTLGRLLVPAAPGIIDLYPVSTEVNRVANKGSELIARVDPSTGEIHGQGTLL